jgi:integrase
VTPRGIEPLTYRLGICKSTLRLTSPDYVTLLFIVYYQYVIILSLRCNTRRFYFMCFQFASNLGDMQKLTKRFIDGLKPIVDKQVFHWDNELRGFGIRVAPSGRCTYIVQYRTQERRQRRRSIGVHGTITPDQARTEARKWLAEKSIGGDPALTLDARRTAPTMEDLAKEYLERHAKKHKRSRSIQDDISRLENIILPSIGRYKVADITRRELESLHSKIKGTPYRANRVLALLSKMFSLAVAWNYRPDNPVKGIQRFQEQKRERWLSEDELDRLYSALAEHLDQRIANAVRLLVLTGARKSEVLGATWDQFDMERGVWTKPSHATKQNKTEHVPLSRYALGLLSTMKETSDCPFLFPGNAPGKPLQDIKKSWKRICEEAELKDVRLHDLRHTFASHLVSRGMSLPIVGKLLGHTQAITTQRYAHLADDPLREAVNEFGKLIKPAT